MKIGDEVYIHGYIDEIRKDTVIIRNDGGYFGTVAEEIKEQSKEQSCNRIGRWIREDVICSRCSVCGHNAIIANWSSVLSSYCPTCGAMMV